MLLAILTMGDGRAVPPAHADSKSPVAGPVAASPAARPAKPHHVTPKGEPPPPPPCVAERYARLSSMVPGLLAKHGAGTAGFREAYAVEKHALVGHDALVAAGCVLSGM